MTDVCRELGQRLAAFEWFHDHDEFASWLDGAADADAERCIEHGLVEMSAQGNWGIFEGYVHAASLRPDKSQTSALCAVLMQHDLDVNYEDIVDALGQVKDPASIDCLAATIRWEPDWDEYRGLAVKCIWALAAIGTPEAWNVLEGFTAEGPEVLREAVAAERSDS